MMRSKSPRTLAPFLLASLALGGLDLVAACSSGSDSHAAPISSDGGSSSSDGGSAGTRQFPVGTGGGSGGSGGTGSAAGGAAGEADQGGASDSNAGAAGADEPGTVVLVPPGTCSETAVWMAAAPVTSVSTDGVTESLISITPDELDIVFMRAGAPFWAHRAAASGTFGAATPVTLPADYAADAGAALSSDGLTLVVISSEGMFGALTRGSRTVDFGPDVDTTAFEGLNQRAVQTLEHFAAPVLSADGKSLVFSGFTPGADKISLVYEALWTAPAWGMPTDISDTSWQGTGDLRPLPTGLSSDSRTLFYYDEKTSKEYARFRDRPDAPLYDSVDLGTLQGAAPNANCSKLYYSNNGDVFTDSD